MPEHCKACKDEGRGIVVAHYASVPAGRSATGKAIPATCWHHHFRKPLPPLPEPVVNAPDPVVLEASARPTNNPKRKDTNMDPKTCACGCGEELPADSRWNYKRGHKPKKNGAARPRATTRSKSTPPRKTAAKPIGVATICVTEANLDNFWTKLSLEEKAALYQQQLESA